MMIEENKKIDSLYLCYIKLNPDPETKTLNVEINYDGFKSFYIENKSQDSTKNVQSMLLAFRLLFELNSRIFEFIEKEFFPKTLVRNETKLKDETNPS